MSLYLGVDVGTRSTKCVVYDGASRRLVSSGAFQYDVKRTEVPGRAEQSPAVWIEGLHVSVTEALEKIDTSLVKGVAVSGQQHGMVLLDGSGQVLRDAKLWCDVEAAAEARHISEASGISYPPGFTGPKILWVKNNEPDVFSQVKHVLLPHDYINFYLTGRFCTECGDASGTALLDVSGRKWDRAAADRIDPELFGCLPELIGPDEGVGHVLPDVAARLGLPEGVLVAPGGGDNMMSALGAAAVRDGVWIASLGTSATLFGYSPRPVVDPSGTVAPFCDCTGAWMPLVCIMNCTEVAEEARKASGLDHAAITALAAEVPAGCQGVSFLTYLTGERTPNWPHATGALLGLRPGSLTEPGLVYRAALEGVTFTLMAGMEKLKEYGCKVAELRVVGGGSKNPLWCQIIADVFQVPVKLPVEGAETAALGAALQAAAVSSGLPVGTYIKEHEPEMHGVVIQPNPDNREAYAKAFQQHVELGKKLFQ